MRFSSLAVLLAGVLSLQLATSAWAEEEYQNPDEVLPEDIVKCYEASVDSDIQLYCLGTETLYWERKLLENYEKAMQSCVAVAQENFTGLEQQEFEANCKKQLKTTQEAWKKYRDGMYDVQCDLSPNFGEAAHHLDCASAYNELVKEQALKLGRVY